MISTGLLHLGPDDGVPNVGGALVIGWQRVGVDPRRHGRVRVPEAGGNGGQFHPRREQMRSVRVPERVEARALRELQLAVEQRDRSRYGVGLRRSAIGVREDQIEIAAAVWSELRAERVLLLAMRTSPRRAPVAADTSRNTDKAHWASRRGSPMAGTADTGRP